MINTIFYFPDSLTFDQYLNKLDQNSDDGIASRTIVLAKQLGKIYNNGKLYGTTSSDVQALINAAKSELEAQDAALNLSIEEAVSLFSSNINSLLNEIASDIQDAINTAKSYDDLIKTDLNTANNQITAVSTKVNQIEDRIDGFSEGGNIKYTQALQSVINSGINNNAAFNNISSRWAVADENQNLLQWMASGFLSQSEQGSSFAQIYSTDKSTINNNILSAAAAVKTAVSTNENGIVSSAMGQILSSLTNNEINNVSGLITKVDEKASLSDVISAISIANTADSKADSANSAASSLSAALTTLDGSVVKKASVIASINSSSESNVTINADKINLNGTVIAQRLLAANAVIGGFTIGQNELSAGDSYNNISLSPSNGLYASSSEMVGDVGLTNSICLDGDGLKTETFRTLGSTTTNQINVDGSGFLSGGALSWDAEGNLLIGGPDFGGSLTLGGTELNAKYSGSCIAASAAGCFKAYTQSGGSLNPNPHYFKIQGSQPGSYHKLSVISSADLGEVFIGDTPNHPGKTVDLHVYGDTHLWGQTVSDSYIYTSSYFMSENGFKKKNYNDDYVLLAGGGTKALSEFLFVSSLSDETLKNKIADVELTAEQIAEAPAIKYTWKDKEKDLNIHVGTIAQYWQEVLPETVSTDSNEKLMLDYQGAAMAAVINLAKEVIELKAKIAELESKLTL